MEEMAKVRTGFVYVYNTCILLQWKPDEWNGIKSELIYQT